MQVNNAIARLETGSYTVTRYAAGTYTNGRLAAGSAATFSIDAVVYPLTGRDLLRLPEALRTTDLRAVITKTQLNSDGLDFVTIDGDQWQVEKSEAWNPSPFWRCFVRRVTV